MAKKTLQDTKQDTRVEIIKEEKNNFVIVYDTVYKSNLTLEEIGLLVKLLSSSPTFKITWRNLKKAYNCSEYQLNRATKGLKDKGYLKIDNNFKTGSKWTIGQQPIKQLPNYDEKTLINALLNEEITLLELKALFHRHYIDYPKYQNVLKTYFKEIQRILKVNPYDEN